MLGIFFTLCVCDIGHIDGWGEVVGVGVKIGRLVVVNLANIRNDLHKGLCNVLLT